MSQSNVFDVVVIGAGAAGMMAAIEAAKRGRKTLLIEHNKTVGQKILISGGGRCNFANLGAGPENYISSNPHFIKSALSRYNQHDFIKLVESYNITYHEKKLGQLFADKGSRVIVDMLLSECRKYEVDIRCNHKLISVKQINENDNLVFRCKVKNLFEKEEDQITLLQSESIIIASGGLSFPKKGATAIGYKVAESFGHKIIKTEPGLVPLVLGEEIGVLNNLAGISYDAIVKLGKTKFRENVLITHRGVSGPAILQISSFWKQGDTINVRIQPDTDWQELIMSNINSKIEMRNLISQIVPIRFAEYLCNYFDCNKAINQLAQKKVLAMIEGLNNFPIKALGSEGYEKAEVTIGGVDTKLISSKTMESKLVSNLYFVGEVVDVTGWLGGYNFVWAWSSGWVAGQYA
jgi:predicted Rossmann fold flavoprotein